MSEVNLSVKLRAPSKKRKDTSKIEAAFERGLLTYCGLAVRVTFDEFNNSFRRLDGNQWPESMRNFVDAYGGAVYACRCIDNGEEP